MSEDTAYFDSKEFKEILQQYEESVKSGESIYMDADDLADIADYYHYNNRLEEANNAIALAMKYNPEAVGPMLYKAREALEKNDFDTAASFADKIAASDILEGDFLQAEILTKKGQVGDANKLLKSRLQKLPEEDKGDFISGVINLFLDFNEFDYAAKWIVHLPDNFDEVRKNEFMARTLFGLEKFEDSEQLFNNLLDEDPYSVNYWNALAGVQYMERDYAACITSCDYALAINPSSTNALITKGNALSVMKNYEEALTCFKKYTELEPDDEIGYLQQGTCLICMDQPEAGIQIFEKAASLANKDSVHLPDIYMELAFAYNTIGNIDKAIWYLDATAPLDCDHINILITKGHLLLQNKRFEESMKAFNTAMQLSNNDPQTRLRIIISYQDNRYLNDAYKAYTEFFESVDKNYTEGYAYMALCCLDLKKKEEYLYYLRKACTCNPQEAKRVFEPIFPEGMEPQDYFEYASSHLND